MYGSVGGQRGGSSGLLDHFTQKCTPQFVQVLQALGEKEETCLRLKNCGIATRQ